MDNFIDYNSNKKSLKDKTEHFVNFVSKTLGLKSSPNVVLVPNREGEMTTALYNLENKEIKVLYKNRAFFDIARSIAHEMVHQKQHENGQHMDGSTGSPCEDEANAVAGRLIRIYSKQNKDFYEE